MHLKEIPPQRDERIGVTEVERYFEVIGLADETQISGMPDRNFFLGNTVFPHQQTGMRVELLYGVVNINDIEPVECPRKARGHFVFDWRSEQAGCRKNARVPGYEYALNSEFLRQRHRV